MSITQSQRGMSTPAIIGIIILLLALGGVAYYASTGEGKDAMKKDGDAMMKEDSGAMMEKEDAMMEKENGDAMMEDKGAMESHDDAMMKEDSGAMMEGDSMQKEETSFNGAVIAGSSSPLLEFDRRDYESALASGKLLMLYFYANWCPLCRTEFESTKQAFNNHTGNDIVGFRVHYKDDDVTADMEALAREFGISSQHTKVFIRNGERILKTPETWGVQRYAEEFRKALGS